MTERQLLADQALVTAHPDLLNPLLQTAADLRQLGRADESLDNVRTRVAAKDFRDIFEWELWWWDGRYRAQLMLGREDAAIASLRSGMVVGEEGGRNISQVLNLMGVLNELRRPQAALDTLAAAGQLGEASASGEM